MKVLLQTTLPGLGQAGEIVNVTDAYARNYLLPQKIAVLATTTVQAKAATRRAQTQKKKAKDQDQMAVAKDRLTNVTVRLSGRGPAGGHLYQALHQPEVFDALAKQCGVSVDGARLDPAIFKSAGQHPALLHWPDRTTTTIMVVVEVID